MSEKDDELWDYATRGVKPLGKKARTAKPPSKSVPLPKAPKRAEKAVFVPPPRAEKAKADPALGLDKRTRDKIKKGKMPIEGKLDLHGLSQARAHEALHNFILKAHGQGKRHVLVITGKGRMADGALRSPLDKGAGILRSRVPEWLSVSPLKDMILKVEPAKPVHGGEGALYVYLRRIRD